MAAHEGSSGEASPGPAVNTTPSTLLCTKCRKPLEGQFVRALEGTFHQDCFTCIDCNKPVASRFFPIEAADGTQQPLCELDYFRRLNLVCASCGDALKGSYITALGKKYHVGHFCCAACSVVFGPDDSYYEYDNNVYCYYHYSIKFAIRCSGCQTAILKQFLDINRNGVDEHWHPECYMIHKYWNVKISQSISEKGDTAITQEQDLSKLTPDQLREVQEAMEIKVYRIWTVLSAFEESAAACISDMLVHVSGGSYLEGLKMADYFVTHVEVVFAAIDDLVAQYQSKGKPEPKYRKESKLLCRKIINFFTLLSHARETGLRPIGLTEELLSLVTGLAHYLKVLIRISLTAALNLDSPQDGQTSPISRFLEQLVELANKQIYSFEDDSLSSLDCDTCQACHETCEDQCFRLAHHRWHDGCFACSKCCLPLRDQYQTAFWDPKDSILLCQGCGSSGTGLKQGFERISRLQQFGFLLRVALRRLYNLLDVNDVPNQKAAMGKSPPGLLTQEARAKSFTDGQTAKETIHLGDIKRMKSTQLRRKPTDSHRVAKRSTILETPSPTTASVASEANDNVCESPTTTQCSLNYPPAQRPTNMQNSTSDGALSLGSILHNAHQKEGAPQRPPSQVYSKNKPIAKFSYIAELSALNHFMVKHIAVLHLEELLKGHFTLEELVDLIDDKKGNSLWGKFVTGLKTGGSKKGPRSKEATFGVPLEALVERTGVESHLGAGASGIRIPAFVEDCISAMKQMDMTVEGIFRKNGNIRRLKDVAEEIDANANVQLTNEGPIQVAALIKKFLRDLPEPLLTFKLYKLFTIVNKLESLEDRKRVLHLSCLLLPKPNRDTMEVLFLFLKWVSSFAQLEEGGGNKMDTLNLATMLAPNILESKNKDPAKDESFAGIEAVRLLLEYQQDFCMVPEDFVLLLESLSYGKGDMEASARDILRKCELVMKLKKPQPQPSNLPAIPVRQHSSPAIMPVTPNPNSQPQQQSPVTTANPSTPLPDLSSSAVNVSGAR